MGKRMGALAIGCAIAATMIAAARAGSAQTERMQIWRVSQFSFRYVESVQNPDACAGGSVSGFDVARETATLTVGKLRNPRPIDYQYTPPLGTPGGPDSRGHSVLAIDSTIERDISKELVDCDTSVHSTISCANPLHTAFSAYNTGAYSVWTVRKRSIVNLSLLLMGDDFLDLLSCRDDPGVVIGSSFLEGATHGAYTVRATFPLGLFRRPSTTLTFSRALQSPANAVSRGLAAGTGKVEATLVVRKSIQNHVWCPARDPLFVCDKR